MSIGKEREIWVWVWVCYGMMSMTRSSEWERASADWDDDDDLLFLPQPPTVAIKGPITVSRRSKMSYLFPKATMYA